MSTLALTKTASVRCLEISIILLNKLRKSTGGDEGWLCRPLRRHHCPRALIGFINIRSNTCNQLSYSWSAWVSVLILTNSSLTLFINILLPFSILIKKKIISGKKKKKRRQTRGRSSSTLLKMHIGVSFYISRTDPVHSISLKQSPWWKPTGSFFQIFFLPLRDAVRV